MVNKAKLTQILAIAGTVLLWLPMLTPAIFAFIRLIQSRRFMFDYLAPAELLPVVLIGGGLLLWAAFRAHLRREIIGWGLAAAAVSLAASVAIAAVTGLASGETETGGWQWALVLVMIAGSWLGLLAAGIGGVLLVRDLIRHRGI